MEWDQPTKSGPSRMKGGDKYRKTRTRRQKDIEFVRGRRSKRSTKRSRRGDRNRIGSVPISKKWNTGGCSLTEGYHRWTSEGGVGAYGEGEEGFPGEANVCLTPTDHNAGATGYTGAWRVSVPITRKDRMEGREPAN